MRTRQIIREDPASRSERGPPPVHSYNHLIEPPSVETSGQKWHADGTRGLLRALPSGNNIFPRIQFPASPAWKYDILLESLSPRGRFAARASLSRVSGDALWLSP